MEEMYEVLKFIEHGDNCRQSLDCVQGTILLDYLRDVPQIEKATLLKWFRELALCLDQYHRCRGRQNFRCLNPYSIVVTEEGSLMLLDMDAPDNSEAARRMQKGAVRDHFVRPVYQMGAGQGNGTDLFAYGKTIQFMLAYAEVAPPLTRREEVRLERIIGQCTGERKKQYEDMGQVLKELPPVPGRKKYVRGASTEGQGESGIGAGGNPLLRSVASALLGAGACLAVCTAAGFFGAGDASAQDTPAAADNGAGTTDLKTAVDTTRDATGDTADATGDAAGDTDDAAGNTAGDTEDTARMAEYSVKDAAERAVDAYEAGSLRQELIEAYGSVIACSKVQGEVEEAAVRKMELEAESGRWKQAVQTGEETLQKLGESEEITRLTEEYKKHAG